MIKNKHFKIYIEKIYLTNSYLKEREQNGSNAI